WQAVTGTQPGERASRFVDPVFTSTSSGNSHSQSDANGADQRGSNPQHDRRLADDLAALRGAARTQSGAVAVAAQPSLARRAPLSTSSHLHTFA
ncbi:MAG TPA: hypothetical protein VEA63_07845, partial [Opitutus sp.]|nr:hypothetical protein [Opitutus sp.]